MSDYEPLVKIAVPPGHQPNIDGVWLFTKSIQTTDFRSWRLKGNSLQLKSKPWIEFELDSCDTPAQALDWIFHIRAKGLQPLEVADLLEAIEIILHPRKNLCSFGASKTADSKALVRQFRHRLKTDAPIPSPPQP
jgi:hypothetical protein